jgi:hypothetical protein
MNLLPDILTDKQYKKLNENGLFNPINVRNHAMCVRYKLQREQFPKMSLIWIYEGLQLWNIKNSEELGKLGFNKLIAVDTIRRIIVANRKLYDIKKPKQERKKK